MRIQDIYACNFKSLRQTQVRGCGAVNVLIGRNNAGKSNILSAVDLVISHLSGGVVSRKWPQVVSSDMICDRSPGVIAQVGITFAWDVDSNRHIRAILEKEAPQHTKAIGALEAQTSVSAIVGFDASLEGIIFLQHLAAGTIEQVNGRLEASGVELFSATPDAAHQLASLSDELSVLSNTIQRLEQVRSNEDLDMVAEHGSSYLRHRYRRTRFSGGHDRASDIIADLATKTKGKSELADLLDAKVVELQDERKELQERAIPSELSTFSGVVRSVPSYLGRIMDLVGGLNILKLGERREPIGRAEADQLLGLKVKRGGAEQLLRVQQTVEALLGVRIDAFRSEDSHRSDHAELDVDEFLVDANGAGVREALRLIIDLELTAPDVVLLEEPEVHLHPGLESALEGYLRKKSEECQMFVTTHSTNFVDAVDFQNVYVVRRDRWKHTECKPVGGADDAWQIPAEIGLRLSTLFMFDRLVFVEGPSDESVLREFAVKLGADLARAGVGFVHMGGVRNYVHYAARATLDLLSKRNIPMWFVVDRDERDDKQVAAMMDRLGGEARLFVLERRELENYLLVPDALRKHLASIRSIESEELPSIADLESDIQEIALDLVDRVQELRLSELLLAPVFPSRFSSQDALDEKLEAAREELLGRIKRIDAEASRIQDELNTEWSQRCRFLAPGSDILDGVLQRHKASFSKRRGDGLRIARQMCAQSIDATLAAFVKNIAGSGSAKPSS